MVENVEGPSGFLGGQESPPSSGVASPGAAGGPVAKTFRRVGAVWMRELARLLETPSAMRVDHDRILALTPGHQATAWKYRLSMWPCAVYRAEFWHCDMACTLEPEHVWYPAAVQQVVSARSLLPSPRPSRKPERCLGLSIGPGRRRSSGWMDPIRL